MYIFIFLIGAVVGAGVMWFVVGRRVSELEKELVRTEKEKEEGEEISSGLEEYNERMRERINERKGRILEALRERDTLQRSDVAEMLEVSKKTAYNYLEELENKGKIVQVGETGRNVRYKLA